MPSYLRGKGREAALQAMDAAGRDDYRAGRIEQQSERDRIGFAFREAQLGQQAEAAAQRAVHSERMLELSEKDSAIRQGIATFNEEKAALAIDDTKEVVDHSNGWLYHTQKITGNEPDAAERLAEAEYLFPKAFKNDFVQKRSAHLYKTLEQKAEAAARLAALRPDLGTVTTDERGQVKYSRPITPEIEAERVRRAAADRPNIEAQIKKLESEPDEDYKSSVPKETKVQELTRLRASLAQSPAATPVRERIIRDKATGKEMVERDGQWVPR